MPVPTFSYVVYLSPWLPKPPGWTKVGLNPVVTTTGVPANSVLAGRLRQGGTAMQTVVAASSTTEVVIMPAVPLSAMLDYYVDVMWVPTGTAPANVNWGATGPSANYATAPVVTATVTPGQGAVTATGVQLGWDFGAAALVPAGANLNAYNAAGTSVGFARVAGTSGTMPFTAAAPFGSQLYLQAVMPIAGSTGMSFTGPFSMGPILAGQPLPLAAPAVTAGSYDGDKVQVGWTPPANLPTTGGAIGYDLVLAVAATPGLATVAEAGPAGGLVAIGAGQVQPLQAAGRMRIGPLVGLPGTAAGLLMLPPTVDQLAVATGAISARVTFPANSPTGATATVTLAQNGVMKGTATASSSTASVSVSGFVAGTAGWTVSAAMNATVSGVALVGPASVPVSVLAAAPTIRDVTTRPATGGGWTVVVTAAAPPPPGTSYAFVLQQDSVQVATQTVANGTTATFTVAQGATPASGVINGAAVAQAQLWIDSAIATSPAAFAAFLADAPAAQGGNAPVISALQNIGPNDPSGSPQGLQVDVATAVSGRTLFVRVTGNGQTVTTSTGSTGGTHVNLPLTQALDPAIPWRVEARWTGSGVDAATFGGWSAPVAVLAATTGVIAAAFDAGTLTLEVQPPAGGAAQGAYLFAWATGQTIAGTNVIGTRGSFALNAGTANWQAAAKPFVPLPAGPNNRSLAPSSASFPLLLAAPTLATIAYDGAQLTAAWSVVNDTASNPATGATLRLSDDGGTIATQAAGSASGSLAIALAPGTQGAVKLAVRATRAANGTTASGAYSTAVAPLVAAPSVGTVSLGATAVTATLTPPAGVPSGTTYRSWLLADGVAVGAPVTGTSPSFAYAAAGVSGLTIVAQAQLTAGGIAMTGPLSAPVPVAAFAPTLLAATIVPAAGQQWQLDAQWAPPADGSAITTYWLRLADGATEIWKQSFGAATQASYSFPTADVGSTDLYTLTLWGVTANGSVTPVASNQVRFAGPAFTAVTVDDRQVVASWTPVADASGYRLQLLDQATSVVLATTTSDATIATLPITGLDPGGSYVLALATQDQQLLFDAGSNATAATRPALLLARPTGLSVATDAATGCATLSWSAVPPPSGWTIGYRVMLSNGTAAITTTDPHHAFTTPFAAGGDLSVTVAATMTKDSVISAGPASTPLSLPTAAPALLRADYDGTTVTAEWQPVANAAGYVVTVLKADGTATVPAGASVGTSVAFASTLAAAGDPYTVVVQATGESGSGLPSAALPLFRTGWFVSTALPAAQPPHVYPAATLALAPTKIAIYLPPLGDQAITVAPVGPFALTANTDAVSKTALPYILTFASDGAAWTFATGSDPAPAIRPQLYADYVTFLKNAETAHAAPWGIAALQLAISRWMPQTFAESHLYAYGLNLGGGAGTGAIDLRPGLVLRVGFADYTNVWSGEGNSWLNGFGGGSPSDFDVADSMSGSGAWQTSMDVFTARLVAAGAMSVAPPANVTSASAAAGVADAADLFYPGFPNPFYRLFFPGQLQNPTGTGSVDTGANFALAGAASYTALTTTSATLGGANPLAYFRGRAVLRVMIRIRVNDAEVLVPLGTTLGNVLDRYGVRPPATGVQFGGIVLERGAGPGLAVFGDAAAPPPLSYDAAARYPVRLDWATMAAYGGPYDATSLPLLHGDRIGF